MKEPRLTTCCRWSSVSPGSVISGCTCSMFLLFFLSLPLCFVHCLRYSERVIIAAQSETSFGVALLQTFTSAFLSLSLSLCISALFDHVRSMDDLLSFSLPFCLFLFLCRFRKGFLHWAHYLDII